MLVILTRIADFLLVDILYVVNKMIHRGNAVR